MIGVVTVIVGAVLAAVTGNDTKIWDCCRAARAAQPGQPVRWRVGVAIYTASALLIGVGIGLLITARVHVT